MSLVTTSSRPVLLLVLVTGLAGCQDEPDELTKARARLAALAATYDIDIGEQETLVHGATGSAHGRIEYTWPEDQTLEKYIPVFVEELSLYPTDLVKRLLQRVVFCEDLSVDGRRLGGLADHDHWAVFLDITLTSDNEAAQRRSIHHELFHFVDYWDGWGLSREEEWRALNRPGFEYRDGDWSAIGLDPLDFTMLFPGFLNHYSTTGMGEDKAEVFATLMVNPQYIEGVARRDAVVCAKTELIRAMLAEFCPELDDEFWAMVKTRNWRRRQTRQRAGLASAGRARTSARSRRSASASFHIDASSA